MESSRIRKDPKSNDRCPNREREIWRHAEQTLGRRLWGKQKLRVLLPQAREHPGPEAGRGQEESFWGFKRDPGTLPIT